MSRPHFFFRLLSVTALTLPAAFCARGDGIPGSRYISGRGAAMGNAFSSFADDGASALFYNPAAIARLKHFQFEPINIQVEANSALTGQAGADLYKFASLDQYRNKLNENPRTDPGAAFALLPNASFQGFAVGLLYQNRLRARSEGGQIVYRSTYQLIPTAGFGLRLASGVLRLGYSLQWVNQASGAPSVAATASPIGWNRNLAEGSGFSHNIGLALTLPVAYQPALNLVMRNAGGVRYTSGMLYSFTANEVGAQTPEDMSVDAALSFVTKLGQGSELKTAFEFQDSLGASGYGIVSRSAAGLELGVSEALLLRAGFGNGYPSAGLGLRTRRAELNLAWFSQEIGTPERNQRDTRFQFQYRIGLF